MDKPMVKGKRVRWILLAIVFWLCIGGLGGVFMLHPQHFPVRVIEVSGTLSQLSEETLVKVVSPHLAKGFFRLEVRAIQDSMAELPWVVSSTVKRVWPDKIQITLQEHVPQARFGDTGVVDTEGLVFYPEQNTALSQLPVFRGPVEKAYEMVQQYYAVLEVLGPLGLKIQELCLNTEGAWEIRLDNGIAIILGRVAFYERLTRFVLAHKLSLGAEFERIAYVDCRYTNGLAIGYKDVKNSGGHDLQ